MKYYAAIVNEDEIRACTLIPPFNMLASYHYFKNKKELIKELIQKGYDIFIDSGAFSAENSGKTIEINDYCNFLKETGAKMYAALDVIGNAKQTLANTEYMVKEHGLDPLPTFHLGGNTKDLEKLFNYNYICLGGLVFASGAMRYCDEVWSIILKNRPDMRVHGFGLTNADLMARYPWTSVDSSSFKGCKRFGRQQILWNGFDFKTFSEEEYIDFLVSQGYRREDLEGKENNKKRWFLYDFYSVQSYKQYGEHLKAVNKIKDFSYLTAQQKLI